MNRHISKKERALLTLSVAQKMAGPGRTPSARTLRKAHRDAGRAVTSSGVSVMGGAAPVDHMVDKTCEKLSGICGDTWTECGSFWSKIKDAATSVSPILPFLSPGTQVAVPIAKAIASRSKARPAAQQADDENIATVVGERGKIDDYTYIFGEDAQVFVEGAGSSELGATRRRMGVPRVGAADTRIPHEVYRASILQRAKKLAGGRQPAAKHMAAAQASVKNDLAFHGISVSIPGARPGRMTR